MAVIKVNKYTMNSIQSIYSPIHCIVILDCAVKNIPFYEKCGFTPKESQMAWYIPT